MDRRKAKIKKAKSPSSPTEQILESISDGVFTVNQDWIITSFNRAAEEITGVSRKEAIGRSCAEVFRSSMCETECALRRTLKTGRPVIGKTGYIIDAGGSRIPISVSTAVLRNDSGAMIGGAETFRDLSDLEALRRELDGRFQIGDLISHSPIMRKLFEVLPAISSSPSTVLILGETGTGKERVARTIHAQSRHADGPFVAVNCGALPDSLLESELFGYKAGAFTGAIKDKPGRFALARGGTILLDEIGEMSPALQVKLLRVLQDRVYEPLGATRSEKTDARVIVATNRDLAQLVQRGDFREDLYYRINVVRIELPPLRKRKEDIPLLVEQFVDHFNRMQYKTIRGIAPEALSLLMAHDWPGNIRELENVIERSFILCNGSMIEITHLPEELKGQRGGSDIEPGIRSARDLLESRTIQKTLQSTNYNAVAAARKLGIHKSTLYRKVRKLDISLTPSRKG